MRNSAIPLKHGSMFSNILYSGLLFFTKPSCAMNKMMTMNIEANPAKNPKANKVFNDIFLVWEYFLNESLQSFGLIYLSWLILVWIKILYHNLFCIK